MERLSSRQRKAYAWFCLNFNLRPELSTPPDFRFTDKDTGELVTHNLQIISDYYDEFKAEEKRMKAAERRRLLAEYKMSLKA